jgi:2-phosphosulfolactate phosphatase
MLRIKVAPSIAASTIGPSAALDPCAQCRADSVGASSWTKRIPGTTVSVWFGHFRQNSRRAPNEDGPGIGIDEELWDVGGRQPPTVRVDDVGNVLRVIASRTMPVPHIVRRSLLAGAADAAGATIIIDTFRAFSTAADLLARRVDRIVLTETLDEARATARRLPDSLLCGEEEGRRPDDFDLGNSPAEVRVCPDPAGRVVVMRTSSGTRAVAAALRSGADPVFAASLMVAGATAEAVRSEPRVTIVAAGFGGTSIADEDEETADLISDRLLHRPADSQRLDRLRAGEGAERLRTTAWIDPADLECCLEIDRHSFALQAVLHHRIPTLRACDPRDSARQR